MSGSSQCAQIRPELGVYVLGAIAPADRARVRWHLASCPGCREEIAGLARLPALLRTVPTAIVLRLSGERLSAHLTMISGGRSRLRTGPDQQDHDRRLDY